MGRSPSSCYWPVEETPLPKLSAIAALLAAIMLVIGGVPARAATGPCDPCPPDCAMMQAQANAAQHQDKAPASDQSPCKAMAICQAPAALPATPLPVGLTRLAASDVRQQLVNARFAPSRPPDRALRPPIQL